MSSATTPPSAGRCWPRRSELAGAAKLQEAWPDHVAATERLLGERFDDEELAALTELLSRVADPLECEPGPSQA